MEVSKPKNSQLLIFPMKECFITAGFKNSKYPTDPNHAFTHFGVDFGSTKTADFDVLASGIGTVLDVEFNGSNSLGGVVVIKYRNVYIPVIKQVKDLIIRYMHLSKINVTKGAAVSANLKIGRVSGSHKWWNHIHFEVDTDTSHPFHTPQVRESSSSMLIARGSNASSMLDPIEVLVIGERQTAAIHPYAVYVNTKDQPKYNEKDFSITTDRINKNYQKLILPVNNATITAGYKNSNYIKKFGFGHFGLDIIGQSIIYASGEGTVLACGLDNVLGNVISIKYEKIINHKTGKIVDIIMRYNHLASLKIQPMQKVDKDTVLGIMGNTGRYSTGTHLHIEIDTDARKQYACWTPTISSNSNIMKAGQDTTINPAEVLHIKTSAPDKQSIKRLFDGYSSDTDIDMPTI